MNQEYKIPLKDTAPIRAISETVSHLLVPDLGGLIQLFVELRAGLQEERAAILRRKEDIRSEAYAAAMRLMLSDPDAPPSLSRNYFERLRG